MTVLGLLTLFVFLILWSLSWWSPSAPQDRRAQRIEEPREPAAGNTSPGETPVPEIHLEGGRATLVIEVLDDSERRLVADLIEVVEIQELDAPHLEVTHTEDGLASVVSKRGRLLLAKLEKEDYRPVLGRRVRLVQEAQTLRVVLSRWTDERGSGAADGLLTGKVILETPGMRLPAFVVLHSTSRAWQRAALVDASGAFSYPDAPLDDYIVYTQPTLFHVGAARAQLTTARPRSHVEIRVPAGVECTVVPKMSSASFPRSAVFHTAPKVLTDWNRREVVCVRTTTELQGVEGSGNFLLRGVRDGETVTMTAEERSVVFNAAAGRVEAQLR